MFHEEKPKDIATKDFTACPLKQASTEIIRRK